jgi:hypothetical protein
MTILTNLIKMISHHADQVESIKVWQKFPKLEKGCKKSKQEKSLLCEQLQNHKQKTKITMTQNSEITYLFTFASWLYMKVKNLILNQTFMIFHLFTFPEP